MIILVIVSRLGTSIKGSRLTARVFAALYELISSVLISPDAAICPSRKRRSILLERCKDNNVGGDSFGLEARCSSFEQKHII